MKTSILSLMIILMTAKTVDASINTPMSTPSVGKITVVQSQNDKELLWVDEQIRAILPARIGVTDGFINSLIDPIKYVHPKKIHSGTIGIHSHNVQSALLSPPKLSNTPIIPAPPKIVIEPLRLKALMNKSALIGLKWYRVGDAVREYTLAEIRTSSVLLSSNKGNSFVLFLNKNNNNIQLNTK